MKRTVLAVVAACLPGAVTAEDMHQHEAHVHGTGALDIAFEGGQVLMELRVPGADIVGFEHEVHDDEDKAAVDSALELLSDPASLFAASEAAGCNFVSAEADLHDEEEDEHDHEDDKHDHDDDEHAHEDDEHGHEDEEHDQEAEAGGHSEFHAEYMLTCEQIGRLDSIALTYFQTFERAEKLEVRAISDKGSFGVELTRDAPVLELKGRI